MASKSRRHGMSGRHASRRSTSIQPRCEQLEGRIAPALFEVQNPMSFTGLNNNGCVATADFNKDGFTDAVLTNYGVTGAAGTTVTVLYGNSSGGFNRIALTTGGTNVAFASVGDINGDTWLDLVAANGNGQNTGSVSVFRNDGAGNLILEGTPFSAGGNNSAWVGLADITGDNILDIVVANFGREQAGTIQGNNVGLFQGNVDQQGKGNFTFSPLTPLAPEIQFVPTSLAIADFDADGLKDIAAVSPGIPPDFGQPYPPGTIYVFEGTGSGGFLAPNQFETAGVLPVNIQTADLNGDGKSDLIVANAGNPLSTTSEFEGDSIGIVTNVSSNGTLLFSGIPNSLTANTHGPFAVAVADFDLDGDQDIAAVNYGQYLSQTAPPAFVSVYLRGANGTYSPASPGTFDTETSIGGGQYLAVGNFDADNAPDLIVAHESNLVGVLLNTSTPAISTTTTLQSSLNPSAAGQSVTFTATVAASSTVTGGTVTFFDNGIPMGAAVDLTNQQAVFTTTTLSAGTRSITATYSGASGFLSSTSAAIEQVVTPGAAQTIAFSGMPSVLTAGATFNVSVSARDQFGNVASGYRGTIHFTSTDGQAVLPSDYTFTAADNGAHIFTITLKTQGVQSVTATDTATPSITGTGNATVNAAAASDFTVAGFPSPAEAGTSQNFTVTALDAFGNVATGYLGTVHFTSTDLQATLPPDYTFTAADNGVHNFSATLKTVGTQSITGTDTASGSIDGAQSGITVSAAVASKFVVSAPPNAGAGSAFSVTVTAQDAFGNTATGYTGTVQFTSTDGAAVLPANYTFTGADAGTRNFTVTLNTAGSQEITATDTVTGSITGKDTVTVDSTAATHFLVSAPPTATAGTSFTITVSALNSLNLIDTNYLGTVHFTSTDGQAILPADYTFTAGDAGVHTFTVTLKTAGSQSITATDGSITGSDTVTVSAAAATNFTVSAPPNATAGAAFSATVTARDAFGNIATSYTGTVQFTSTDGAAVLPPNTTFTGADAGTRNFNITLNTTGNQTITATDTVTGSINGSDIVAVGNSPPPPPTAQPFAVGTPKGPVASVTLFNPDRTVEFNVQPFGPNYRQGVRIAVGDVTGDGVPDVVAATNGVVRAKARIIDGATGAILPNELLGATQYRGKVAVAVGDIDNDGTDDIVLGLNAGGSRVKVLHGGDFTKMTGFLAAPAANFRGNTAVALSDMTGDGKADLVVSSLYTTGSRVAGFNGASLVPGAVRERMFTRLMLGGPYVSGLFLALGDVNGDSRADLVIGSPGTRSPNVKVFSGEALVDNNTRTRIASFVPGGSTKSGVRVAVRDINGDGTVDIVTSSGEMVSAFQGGTNLPAIGLPPLMFSFDPDSAFIGSVWVG